MKKNIILGTAIGYNIEQLSIFVKSWKQYCPKEELWLIVDANVDTKTKTWLDSNNIKCFFHTASNYILTGINNTRYYKYFDILLEHIKQIDKVFLTDVRDVVFQGNIFEEIEEAGLHCFLEDSNYTCQTQKFNKDIILTAYGKKVLKELGDKEIICSGTTYGDVVSIVKYLELMINQFNTNQMVELKDENTWGIDQAWHTYILHNNLIENIKHQNGDGVGTLAIVNDDDIEISNEFIKVYKKTPSIIHQYDRHEKLNEFLTKKYSKEFIKILIATPCFDSVMTAYTQSLVNACCYTMATNKNIKLAYITSAGTYIHESRIHIVDEAIKSGADYIIWIDADMQFPSDSFVRLLSHELDFVGVNYSTRRGLGGKYTACVNDPENKENFFTITTSKDSVGIQEVDVIGFGLCLMSTHLFKDLERPYFRYDYQPMGDHFRSEDYQLCRDLKEKKNTRVYIDHDLSKEIYHVGTYHYNYESPLMELSLIDFDEKE